MADQRPAVEVFAPAKINLTLHVTGQRADGYHLIDSLVVFAEVGDRLRIAPGDAFSMTVGGPEANAVPRGGDNLILQVARLFDGLQGAGFDLIKDLPVSSGIGGGSADAAATYRGLSAILESVDRAAELLALGADIPMCLHSVAARVGGIGEEVDPLPELPALHAVLVNPRRAVSTPSVFKALVQKSHPPMPKTLPTFKNAQNLVAWLAEQRNDLEGPAMSLEPSIAEVKTVLASQQNCLLARMSGSGATCFGVFPDQESAERAALAMAQTHPDWWVKAARLGSQSARARPQLIRSTT